MTYSARKLLSFAFFAAWLLVPFQAFADERILDFHSDVMVHPDSSMTVTETIRVRAEGQRIRHGIYRDFPTIYSGTSASAETGFKVLEVQRDGVVEAFHRRDRANGWRVYFGDEDVLLSPGEYTYGVRYETNRQLNFTNTGYDQLYWNVTGNGWDFPIDHASVTVHLPDRALNAIQRLEGFTGAQGSQRQDCRCGRDSDNAIACETTSGIYPGGGFTVLAQWPKGIIFSPSLIFLTEWFFQDHPGAGIMLLGLFLLWLYFIVVWVLVGIDPDKGTIIPLYEPPPGVSPAMARFMMKMGFDQKIMTVVTVSLATKGYVLIQQDKSSPTIIKLGKNEKRLSPEEKDAADLFFSSYDQFVFDTTNSNLNYLIIGQARARVERALRTACERVYFVTNQGFFAGGFIISLVVIALTFISGAGLFVGMTALIIVLGLLAIVGTNILFYYLLKAPTLLGRRIMDQIEGFKMFLETADGERIRAMYRPEQWPQVYEKNLPYAIALDVEEAWSNRLTAMIDSVHSTDPGYVAGSYCPVWYSGPSGQGFGRNFSSSLQGAIVAASVAPASSGGGGGFSGGGGGGFSGGGGGGGGGGGW
jgi:uncharacterized membrane protein YgcG